MRTVLLVPLRKEGIEMAHMDPTKIIVVPISLQRLVLFVTLAVLGLFIVSVPWWELAALWNALKTLVLTTAALYIVSILCGLHPLYNIHSTLLASFYIAALVSMNPTTFGDGGSDSPQALLFLASMTRTRDDIVGMTRFYTTLLVCIPFQILNVLDSGLQIQRLPLPMLLGSTVGWTIGSIVGLLLALYNNSSNKGAESYTTNSPTKNRNI
jgi:hypothetical protein